MSSGASASFPSSARIPHASLLDICSHPIANRYSAPRLLWRIGNWRTVYSDGEFYFPIVGLNRLKQHRVFALYQWSEVLLVYGDFNTAGATKEYANTLRGVPCQRIRSLIGFRSDCTYEDDNGVDCYLDPDLLVCRPQC